MIAPLASHPLRELPAPGAQARALHKEIAPLVGGRASLDSRDRLAASRDVWPRALLWERAGHCGPLPDLVAWPGTAAEVSAVVRRAGELGVPIVPLGGGSGGGGAIVPVAGGIALDLRRMGRVLALDAEALEVEAEAGILGQELERRLNRAGLTLGHHPDDACSATLGGWLATRSAGRAAGRCGALEDMVVSLTAVDGRGEVLSTPRRAAPGSMGWDAGRLLLGSEGCLAVICAARLLVRRLPEARAFQSWRFDGFREGVEVLRAMARAGLRPAAVRLSDPADALAGDVEAAAPIGRRGAVRRRFDEAVVVPLRRLAGRAAGGRPWGLNQAARVLRSCRLLLCFEGPADLCELEAEEAARLCQAARAEDLGPDPARDWLERQFSPRFAVSPAFDAGGFVDVIDVCATWDRALEVHRRVREALAPLALVRARIAHVYPEGCSLELAVAASAAGLQRSVERHEAIWRQGLAAARAAGAAACHHGGVGLQRLNALQGQLGEGMRILSALKAVFDPKGIMNPGKLGCG